jgi:hypothetical protein
MQYLPRYKYLKPLTSTTGHVFDVIDFSKVSIALKHQITGCEYLVIYTDSNEIRDYKNGPVRCLGVLTESDITTLKNLAK